MYFLKTNREHFTNSCISYQIEKPTIWMYWENIPGKKRASYLDICYETVLKHCRHNFDIKVLDETSVYQYLPNLRKDLADKLDVSPKTDVIRFALLDRYGGIWVDFDTIIFRDLMPIINQLQNYDFVGFGCHDGYNCQNGHPRPATWVMASRPNNPMIKMVIQQQNQILDRHDRRYFKKNYFRLGRVVLWECINKAQQTGWDYYHWDSKCLERDSLGNKLVNQRSISKEDIDPECLDKMLFVPIYNSAPGFPKWFTSMSKQQLLQSPMLISKLFRKSLTN